MVIIIFNQITASQTVSYKGPTFTLHLDTALLFLAANLDFSFSHSRLNNLHLILVTF